MEGSSGYTEPAAMAAGWVGRGIFVTLRSLIRNLQRAVHSRVQAMLAAQEDDEDSESGEASSAHTGDGEEPWYEATWEGWGSGFGRYVDGAGEPAVPQINAGQVGMSPAGRSVG